MVLYDGKTIAGKVSIEMVVSQDRPKIYLCENEQSITIEINCPQNPSWQSFVVTLPTEQKERVVVAKGTPVELKMNSDFYK